MTLKEAAIKVLKSSQEPLDAQTITKRMLEQNLWISNGKTPVNTVLRDYIWIFRQIILRLTNILSAFDEGFLETASTYILA